MTATSASTVKQDQIKKVLISLFQSLMYINSDDTVKVIAFWISHTQAHNFCLFIVASMITSRLDYCNATFAGVANEQIACIQKIQNNTARLILKKSKRDHVTPLLKELHRLPVKYRIQYKLATLAFHHFDGTLPPCLSSSLCTYQPSCSLRSSTERLLKIPKTNLKTFGECSLVTLLRLSGTRCRPTWELLPPSQLSKLT